MPSEHTQPQRPTVEQLAAYVDGELNASACRAVEEWLAVHAEDRAEVEAQRRLARLVQATMAPEPSAGAWAAVCSRIDTAVANAERGTRNAEQKKSSAFRIPRSALALGLALPLMAAASVLLALFLSPARPPRPVHPFPVASEDDVEIISMDGADVPALVVGQPPVRGPLVLASPEDVTIHDWGKDVEIIRPEENPEGPSAPWIWAPRSPDAGKEP